MQKKRPSFQLSSQVVGDFPLTQKAAQRLLVVSDSASLSEQGAARPALRTTGKITQISSIPSWRVATLAMSGASHVVDRIDRKAAMGFHFTHFRVSASRHPPVLHLQALPNIAAFRPRAAAAREEIEDAELGRQLQEKEAFIAGLAARVSVLNDALNEAKKRERDLAAQIARMNRDASA